MNIRQIPANRVVADALKSVKTALGGIALLGIPINLLMLTGPLFMLQVYDRVLASGSVPTLVVLGILTLGLFTFYGLLEGIRARVLLRIGQKLDTELSDATYESTVSLPLYLGPQAARVDPIRDLDAVKQFLSGPGPSAIFDIPWIPFYLAIIFLFHPILGFVALSGAIVICILIVLNEMFSRKPTSEAARHGLERARMAEAGRQNFEVVRAMGMLSAFREHWSAHNEDFLASQQRAADTSSFFSTLIKSFRFILQSAMLGTGAWLAIIHEVSPGIIIAGSILTSRALSPVEQAVGQWRGFIAARQGLKRLREAIEKRPVEPERMELPLPRKALTADNVVSGKGNQAFLKGVSFALDAGEGLGVIGPTGAGKTSLARTLVGVYQILRGEMRADGADLYQWVADRQGDFIGYLPQNIQLFDGTIAQNIARFRKDASADDVIEAAELADAHALITSLPDGYDTLIGASGFSLSGGQMQRIALARALYGKPFLVILDEPNSNLDADGETALTRAIKTMRALNSIVIVIAHRPSAIQGVDKLLFLKDGRSVAFGPKDEVLKQVLGTQPKIVASNQTVPKSQAAQ